MALTWHCCCGVCGSDKVALFERIAAEQAAAASTWSRCDTVLDGAPGVGIQRRVVSLRRRGRGRAFDSAGSLRWFRATQAGTTIAPSSYSADMDRATQRADTEMLPVSRTPDERDRDRAIS